MVLDLDITYIFTITSYFLPSIDPDIGQQEMTDFPSRAAEYLNEQKLGWMGMQASKN